MNEKIGDERLEFDEHDIEEMLTSLDVCNKHHLVLSDEETKWITAGLRELLSLRSLNKRLVDMLNFAKGNLSITRPEMAFGGDEYCDYDFCVICNNPEYDHKEGCKGVKWQKDVSALMKELEEK